MEQLKDKIYDAYYFEKGDEFAKKVRTRIHWITQNTVGNKILDVGCSQGISSILLGREGKKVLAIDSSSSAIKDAEENLLKEEEEVQQNVKFIKANFFINEFDDTFDTVILGEVLEHITDITTFFNKAIELTNEKGRIIVTTPFGINEFIDHKRTFYLHDFLQLQSENLYIEEIKFFGKWIGVIYKKINESNNILTLNNELLKEFEENIYCIEEEYLKQLKYFNKKVKNKGNDFSTKTGTISKEEYLKEKVEKVNLQKELVEAYNKSESLIKAFRKLSKDYETLQNRYMNLRNSKLGKIATKYWKIRNKKRGK
jgi:2-polyprenyl-3-methyl-5-hydroxy-6-metoxy-1,4-benzoquinol methylase